MSGKRTYEECSTIRTLGIFHEAEYCYRKYDLGDYEFYIQLVGRELGNSVGDIYSDYKFHIDIEVEAASKVAAKKWCDYIEGK